MGLIVTQDLTNTESQNIYEIIRSIWTVTWHVMISRNYFEMFKEWWSFCGYIYVCVHQGQFCSLGDVWQRLGHIRWSETGVRKRLPSCHVWRPGVLLSIVVCSGQGPQQRTMGPKMWGMPRLGNPVLETHVEVAVGQMIGWRYLLQGVPGWLSGLNHFLWLGSWSWDPRIESRVGLSARRGACFPLSLSACLSAYLWSLSVK